MRLINSFFFVMFFFTIGVSQTPYFPPLSSDDWDTVGLSELGWCTDQLPPLYDFLEQGNTKAFILLKDGKIAIEKYFGTFTADSLWYWASAGKTLTAFMVGKAQEEGDLLITDTTSTYLGQGWTNLTVQQEEQISIRHQLAMVTGLDDGVSNVDCTDPNCLVYKADPGTRWAYHNGPYTLLQDVVEAATGTNFNLYMNPRLKQPIGMDGLFVPLGTYNRVYFSKPRSMARFGLLMLNNGNWNGSQIMSDMTYFNEMVTPSQTLNNSYGYLWWLNGQSSYMLPGSQFVFSGAPIPSAPNDVYAAMGKNGQFLNVSPSTGLVLVRMGNNPDNSLVPTFYCDTIWQKLNAIMCGTTAIESDQQTNFNIYPNPSLGTIYIKGISEKATLQMYGLDGRLVWKKFLTNSTDVVQIPSSIPRGIYVAKLSSQGRSIAQKIILE